MREAIEALNNIALDMEGLALVLRGEGSPEHSEDLRNMATHLRSILLAHGESGLAEKLEGLKKRLLSANTERAQHFNDGLSYGIRAIETLIWSHTTHRNQIETLSSPKPPETQIGSDAEMIDEASRDPSALINPETQTGEESIDDKMKRLEREEYITTKPQRCPVLAEEEKPDPTIVHPYTGGSQPEEPKTDEELLEIRLAVEAIKELAVSIHRRVPGESQSEDDSREIVSIADRILALIQGRGK